MPAAPSRTHRRETLVGRRMLKLQWARGSTQRPRRGFMPAPSASSQIVDNGSSHRGQASVERLETAWPNHRLIHLPVHASWLNQIEIYFGVIQRKVLSPNDFADLDAVEHRLLAFGERYEQLATPFEWKFTRADLRRLMARLERSPLIGAAA